MLNAKEIWSLKLTDPMATALLLQNNITLKMTEEEVDAILTPPRSSRIRPLPPTREVARTNLASAENEIQLHTDWNFEVEIDVTASRYINPSESRSDIYISEYDLSRLNDAVRWEDIYYIASYILDSIYTDLKEESYNHWAENMCDNSIDLSYWNINDQQVCSTSTNSDDTYEFAKLLKEKYRPDIEEE